MTRTLFRCTERREAAVLIVLISSLLSAQGFYDVSARRLEIAPKDCTSLKFPSAIGTCMFNLKCKEKLGVVIGACVDRFLFGACCHFPVSSASSELNASASQNATLSSQGISSSTPKLGPDDTSSNLDFTQFPTTIESVPLRLPAQFQLDSSDPSIAQASSPLQFFDPSRPNSDSSTMSTPTYSSSILSIPLERLQSGNNHRNLSGTGIISNESNLNNGLLFPMEHTTVTSGQMASPDESATFPVRNRPQSGFLFQLEDTTLSVSHSTQGFKGQGPGGTFQAPGATFQAPGPTFEAPGATFASGATNPAAEPTFQGSEDPWKTDPTEEPPTRFSTFMYVDGIETEPSETTTMTPNGVKNDPLKNVIDPMTTPGTPPIADSGETLWSIVHQLVPYPSKEPPGQELQLNPDELYTVLSASDPVGSILENRIEVIPPPVLPPVQRPLIWKLSTESSVSDTHAPVRMPTNRPWASSTYQIHTFKYPPVDPTTPLPGSGLVTWHGPAAEESQPKLPSTTEMPSTVSQTQDTYPSSGSTSTVAQTQKMPPTTATTTTTTTTSKPNLSSNVASTATFLVRTTTKPVAEITKPPPPTTTTTTTTEKPTTTSTTTEPPKKKTTPKPKVPAPLPPLPPKKPSLPQAGILQSDFDSNIDDFVNQVVQNLAGSLDNLDLDEVILHPPLPSSSPSSISEGLKDDTPPTLHPLHVLSDPLFPAFPVMGQVPLIKPQKLPVKKIPPATTSRPLDFRRDCGVRSLTKQGRIVGGSPSKFGKWPWQALVREATWLGLFSKNKCGGVLISSKYVLTAAHCQPGFLATLTVVLGDFDISSETEGASAGQNMKNANSVTKNVRRVIVHRDYNAQTFENDIALLELETVVEYQPHIVPICLPMDNEVNVGQQAIVTGWGRLKYGGGVPNMLYEVDVPILNNTECQNMFLKSGHIKAIRDSFICAGYANGAKDSCEGDSGGPLAMMRPNGQWMLAGTVSHGIKCAYPNLPGVYMRMTYYKPWIKRVTGITTVD